MPTPCSMAIFSSGVISFITRSARSSGERLVFIHGPVGCGLCCGCATPNCVIQAKLSSNIAGNPARRTVCFIVPSLIKRFILDADNTTNKGRSDVVFGLRLVGPARKLDPFVRQIYRVPYIFLNPVRQSYIAVDSRNVVSDRLS